MPDSVLLLVDERGTIQAASAAAEELLGPCRGRPCASIVAARQHERLCEESCAQEVIAGTREAPAEPAVVRERFGQLRCTPLHRQLVVSFEAAPGASYRYELLTAREKQVLQLVAEGLTSRVIAEELEVGHATVRTHVEHCLAKLGAHTRSQAVARAMLTGQIAGPG